MVWPKPEWRHHHCTPCKNSVVYNMCIDTIYTCYRLSFCMVALVGLMCTCWVVCHGVHTMQKRSYTQWYNMCIDTIYTCWVDVAMCTPCKKLCSVVMQVSITCVLIP